MENVYFVSSEDSGESNALISIEFKLYFAAVSAELTRSRGEGVRRKKYKMTSDLNFIIIMPHSFRITSYELSMTMPLDTGY